MKVPSTIKPEQIVAVVDTREQNPWSLEPLQTVSGSLPTGDYTVRGLEHVVAVERKSPSDFLGCCGTHRPRFEREVKRLLAFPHRALIIEAAWLDLERAEWKSKITSAAAIGSLLGWISDGLPCVLAGDRQRADRFAARFLYTVARRHWRTLRILAGEVGEVTQ